MKPSHRQVLVSFVLFFLLLAAAMLLRPHRSPEAPEPEMARSSAGVPVAGVEAASVTKPLPGEPGTESGGSVTAPLPPEALPSDEQASLWAAFSQARRAIRPLTG
ncbi:MAG: hypothetical protein ACPG3X_06615, partial [Opitutales bacterium]